MAQLTYADQALNDLERLMEFLLETDLVVALETADLIVEAVSILQNHPLMGRPAEHDMRELVISRGRSGYVALYSYEEHEDSVLILAIRHQREIGYAAE